MQLQQRIAAFSALGKQISTDLQNHAFEPYFNRAFAENGWFTAESIKQSLEAIAKYFLDEAHMREWLESYDLQDNTAPQTVGLVLAGNIPLVGWHDVQTVLISGNKAMIKFSSKDKVLMERLLKMLVEIEPAFEDYIIIAERLKDFDAVIATGSGNTVRYFEYYFGKYPHVIRGSRNSVAVLTGNETNEELENLGEDVFSYFGLGCRNISKLYVPKDYNFNKLFEAFEKFKEAANHNKYRNNYEYHKSLLLLNREHHLDNGYLIIREDKSLASAVASLNFEYYSHISEVEKMLQADKEKLQCVVTKDENITGALPLGTAQRPMDRTGRTTRSVPRGKWRARTAHAPEQTAQADPLRR
ncbi:MAG: hypothetical protein EOP53_17920, partial [Sphingobacteriales bacterium]